MSTLAVLNAYVYSGARDFTGDINEWRLACEAEAKECSNFRSNGWREYKLGRRTSAFEMSGHYQSDTADAVDPHIFDNLGVTNQVITTGDVETEGQPAYMHRGMQVTADFFGAHGEIAPFRVTGSGTDGPTGVVRGQLAVAKQTISTTGAKGTALNLGLVGSGQYLYATLHLVGTAGSSITAIVESDEDNTFSSATTRISFGAQTAVGGYWGTRVAGAIADDDWFRVNVSAVSGSWSVAAAIGIGS